MSKEAPAFAQNNPQSRSDNLLLEYSQYLEDPATELTILHKYPNVKSLFLKYNTPIPSTAPVERLFSFDGLIHTAKRNRLWDKMFETLLMLKANANFETMKTFSEIWSNNKQKMTLT